jgi:hypothetical protein
MKPLHLLQREATNFLAPLKSNNHTEGKDFAARLIQEAQEYGLNLRDYLRVKIDPTKCENAAQLAALKMNGYEAALSALGLPVANDIDAGIMLQAGADVFQTFPGTRIIFPQVIDDIVRYRYKQTQFEQVSNIVSQSRTINGVEMISVVVDDKAADYQGQRAISEGGPVPIYQIKAGEQAVRIWKFGMGWEYTYEFARRISLDLLTPYAMKTERETERSKVWAATNMLVNGDGVQGAAPEVDQSSFNTSVGTNATNGKISYQHLLAWLVSRAQSGNPIDTVVGNYDAYLQWLLMFAVPQTNSGESQAETLARTGFMVRGVPILTGTVDFVLSAAAPANKLIGFSKADTIEELIESGSQIQESEQLIRVQKWTYVRTENAGFRLIFGDTRSVFDFGN